MGFVYGRYRTMERAEEALDEMFANGEVCEAELIGIQRRGKWFCVILRG